MDYKKRSRCIIATLAQPALSDEEIILKLNNYKDLSFYVFQREIGIVTQQVHLQMYMEFKCNVTLGVITGKSENITMLSTALCTFAEHRRGTNKEAIAYCSNDEKRIPGHKVYTYGVSKRIYDTTTKDVKSLKDIILRIENEEITITQRIREYPSRVSRNIERIKLYMKNTKNEKLDKVVADNVRNTLKVELCEWQKHLIDIVEGPYHIRKVYWVYDKIGGRGKSLFGAYLVSQYGAKVYTSTKLDSCLYSYNNEKVIVFDLPRATKPNKVDYTTFESFKNSYASVDKYMSTTKTIAPNHLIVFSNILPDFSKISDDRWVIITLSPPSYISNDKINFINIDATTKASKRVGKGRV